MWTDEVDRLLALDDLDDVASLPMQDLRRLRAECAAVETKVSYLRRLVQGRLDIVGAELRSRADGGPPVDLPSLVDQLPQILSDRVRAVGPGRLPVSVALPDDDDELTAELDEMLGAGRLSELSEMTDADLQALAEELAGLERRVSDARRALFTRLDALQAELVRRYRTGEATVGSVLS
ncbi:MAG: AmfC protein [Acidimicrobiales bacterium]